MEFRVAVFFLYLYYLRPQDWVEPLIGVNIIRPIILVWLVALTTSRQRSELPGLLRTPHDWVIVAYYAYIVWNAPDSQAAFKGFLPMAAFYALTVHSLTTWDRLLAYMKAWNLALLGVAGVAVTSLYGMDLTGAVDVTAANAGRLSIGTWLHNNPNSLAHTVVAVLGLGYMLYFWKGSATGRLVVYPLSALLAIWCAYHTQSKGAYLVAGGLVSLIFVIGRPFAVKALAVAMAMTLGISALSFLPRMSQMSDLRANEGVMGRLLAWEMARTSSRDFPTGVGWKQFEAWVTWEDQTFLKATHSSYVQIGADLGTYGMFLFLGGLWVAARSLVSAAQLTRFSDEQERVRRAGLILIAAYAASSWMINREYHTEYFLIVAVAAAAHRLTISAVANGDESNPLQKESNPEQKSNSPVRLGMYQNEKGTARPKLLVQPAEAPSTKSTDFWRKWGLIDLATVSACTWATFWIWDYILENL